MFATIAHDARYAVRVLRKNPIFTLVAVAVIAVGIGAVSAIYTVADAAVLRPVPGVRDISHVVTIDRTGDDGRGTITASYPFYQFVSAKSHTLSGIAAWDMLRLTVSTGNEATEAQGNIATGNYFNVLGVRPALGRLFVAGDDSVPGLRPVVVISYQLWHERFHGDSTTIGRHILVDGQPFTVIGVAQPRFTGVFPAIRVDVWIPMMMQEAVRPGGDLLHSVGSGWLKLFGRTAPGASRAAARAELAQLARQYATGVERPVSHGEPPFGGIRLSDLSGLPSDVHGATLAFFVVLLVLSGLVLLIASVNVTGMLLVRAVARRRELAVRIALGAAQRRLLIQLLTESVVLFAIGGALGIALATVATGLLARIPLPADVALSLDLSLTPHTLLLTVAVTLACGVIFGMIPALRASRVDLAIGLRADGAGAGRARSRLRSALVAAQLATSLLLLAVSGLFVTALARGRQVKPGYDIDHIATAAMDVSRSGYDSTRAEIFTAQLTDRLRKLPGVTAVAWTRSLPLSMNSSAVGVNIPGRPATGPDKGELTINFATVDAGYFDALHLPLVAGRGIRPSDDASAPGVVVISREFARVGWPGRDAIGQQFSFDGITMTVVGIAPDVKFGRLDEPRAPFMYLPLAQHWTSDLSLMVRTTGNPTALAGPIRAAVRSLDATLPAPLAVTLEQSAAVVLLPQRVAAIVTSGLGFAGLLLSIIGLYGVVAYSAAQRTREMAIRQALGATRVEVLRLVIGDGMRVVAVGVGIGLLLAGLVTRALVPFLFGVSPLDPTIFAAGALLLGLTALLASWIPAQRASRIHPMVALRGE